MTALEFFIQHNQFLSYLIIFAGVLFIEADLFFLTAAVFTQAGYLDWILLLPIAFVGVVAGDLGFYLLGRYGKETRLGLWVHGRFKKLHSWIDENFMPRYHKVIYFAKFLAYINRFLPFIAGWHKMDLKRFLKIHAVADLLWLVTVTAIGVGLANLVAIIGLKAVFRRIWIFFLALGVIVVLGDYFLNKIFSKRIKKEA